MPDIDLHGKTIMFVAPYNVLALRIARRIGDKLQELGAKAEITDIPGHHAVDWMAARIERHDPKIDALFIFNSFEPTQDFNTTTHALIKQFKDSLPVIVSDSCSSEACIQSIRKAGAKFVNCDDWNYQRIAFAVADVLAQHGKPGKSMGGG